MQEVDLQDLTYSAGVQHMRSDAERAAEIMARDGDDLTESEAVFVDTYLQNYDHVKAKLEALGRVAFCPFSLFLFHLRLCSAGPRRRARHPD